jgi:hypothetical protein
MEICVNLLPKDLGRPCQTRDKRRRVGHRSFPERPTTTAIGRVATDLLTCLPRTARQLELHKHYRQLPARSNIAIVGLGSALFVRSRVICPFQCDINKASGARLGGDASALLLLR